MILKSSKKERSNQKNSSRLQILSSLIILNIMFDHWDPSTRYEKTVASHYRNYWLHARNHKYNENSDACRLKPAIATTNDGLKTRKLPTKKPYLSGILIKNKEESIVTFSLLILLTYTMMYAVVFEMLHHLQ